MEVVYGRSVINVKPSRRRHSGGISRQNEWLNGIWRSSRGNWPDPEALWEITGGSRGNEKQMGGPGGTSGGCRLKKSCHSLLKCKLSRNMHLTLGF